MVPSFLPGDRLLAERRGPSSLPISEGDVVVLQDPERAGCLLLKRVEKLIPQPGAPSGPLLVVRGENDEKSRDSRHFGPVSSDRVVGLVWYRYFPPSRRGNVPTPRVRRG